MFNHFSHNRGPVFMPDSVGGTPSTIGIPMQGGASGGAATGQSTAMFDQSMSDQTQMYQMGQQQKKAQDMLQTEGDAAMKTLKAIQF